MIQTTIAGILSSTLRLLAIHHDHKIIEDIVWNSTAQAWFNGKNFIEYCISLKEDVLFCILFHIIWFSDPSNSFIKKIYYVLRIPEDKVVNKNFINILKHAVEVIKSKHEVCIIFDSITKDVADIIASIGRDAKSATILYRLYDVMNTPVTLRGEEDEY